MLRKLMKNGNGWAIAVNKTILELLRVNPETDLVEYTIETDKLTITKSKQKRADIEK